MRLIETLPKPKSKKPTWEDFPCDACGHSHNENCRKLKKKIGHKNCPSGTLPRCKGFALLCDRCTTLRDAGLSVVYASPSTHFELVCGYCLHGVREDKPSVFVKYETLPPEGRMRNFASGSSLSSFDTLEADTRKFNDDGEIIEPRLRYR